MSSSILSTVVKAEELIHDSGTGFSMPEAELYVVKDDAVTKVASQPDVYDLLFSIDTKVEADKGIIVIATTGWAAPLNEDGEVDGPPSANPDRRRVRLVIGAFAGAFASVMRFEDGQHDIVTDDGEATGTLAEAILALYA